MVRTQHVRQTGPIAAPETASPAEPGVVATGPDRVLPVGGLLFGEVRRLAVSDDPLGGTTVPDTVADRLARPPAGSALPADIQRSFGAEFGADLTDVRVHADSEAHDLARSVAATAFTVGSDIYFTRGSYSTASESGRHLLAHELTHVVQNRDPVASSGPSAPIIGRADDPAERQADRIAGTVLTALRRRASNDITEATALVDEGVSEPAAKIRTLQRRHAAREAVPTGAVVRRMSVGAATQAKVDNALVWVRDKDGRWVPGRIRELAPTGQAVVELADAGTIVVAVTDINDAPPPDMGLDDGSPRPLALRPETGALTAPTSLADASPQVRELFERLSALSQEQQRAEIRRMLLASHSDKGGPGDTATFMAVQMVRDLLRNPQQQGPVQPAPQLMLTDVNDPGAAMPELGLPPLRLRLPPPDTSPPPADLGRELPGQPFTAPEIAVLSKLPQVATPADLARLAQTGRPAALLAAVAGLRTVTTIDGVVTVAAINRPFRELARLVELAAVIDVSDLIALAASPYPCARLLLFGKLPQVHSRLELLQLAASVLPDAAVVSLAGIAQAADLTGLGRLTALVGGGRSVDDIVAIGQLPHIATVVQISTLAALSRPMADLAQLAALPLVVDGTGLLLLAGSAFATSRLTTLAALGQVHDPDDLVDIAGWAEADADIVALAGIAQAADLTDLGRLTALVGGGRSVADIVAIGLLPTVATVADISALAGLARSVPDLTLLAQLPLITSCAELALLAGSAVPTGALITLAGLAQATSLADLQLLVGAVGASHTAADVVTVAGIGSATFAVPTATQVAALCALPKSAAQIVQLSTVAGVTGTTHLIALANRTDTKEKVDAEWSVIDNRWYNRQANWGARWPLTALFGALDTQWTSLAPVMRALPSGRHVAADPADLQTYAMTSAQMINTLDAIDALVPALDEGATALASADARLAALATLLTEINTQFIPFYPTPSPARTTVNNQALALAAAQNALALERGQLIAERGYFATIGALTAGDAAQAVIDQHNHTTALAAVPTLAAINAPLVALRTAGYQERLTYRNLNLSRAQVTDAFWQSLLQPQKALWNTKLAGCTVTAWGHQGHPGPASRARQNGYAGANIMIPVIQGFPCRVSGEVVHDWIFETIPNHGHRATKILQMVTLALAGQGFNAGPNFPVTATSAPQGGGRTLYSWTNTQVRIIIAAGAPPTLITYFNPY
ncbi:eCIS core domain-containing protein [Nakamurella sp. GG22]